MINSNPAWVGCHPNRLLSVLTERASTFEAFEKQQPYPLFKSVNAKGFQIIRLF